MNEADWRGGESGVAISADISAMFGRHAVIFRPKIMRSLFAFRAPAPGCRYEIRASAKQYGAVRRLCWYSSERMQFDTDWHPIELRPADENSLINGYHLLGRMIA